MAVDIHTMIATTIPAAPTEPTGTLADELYTQEKLLLSQAVYKVGAVAWPIVSKLLSDHPVCTGRPAGLFTPESCESAYIGLMTSIGQNVPAADAIKPQAKVHLRLAQTFYLARLNELQTSISEYESRFKVLMTEINAVKAGQLDGDIQKELRGVLARKYGKKWLESWVPPSEEVKGAVEAGPPKDGEVEVDKDGGVHVEALDVEKPVEETREELTVEDRSDKSDQAPTPADQAKSPIKDQPKDVDDETVEPHQKLNAPATPSIASPPASVLSPPPSVQPERGQRTPIPVPSPSPVEETSTRASKRKASAQPKGVPPVKRSGRGRAASPVHAHSEPASGDEAETADQADQPGQDEQAEPEPDAEEEALSARGRKTSRRQAAKQAVQHSPAASTRTKELSPAPSRRAPSASSAASATPTTQVHEDRRSSRRSARGGRGMRDEVVSKSVREQSAAVESVKEEEDEDGAEDEQPSRGKRSSRRGRADPVSSEDKREKERVSTEDKKEKDSRRSKRGSVKTPIPPNDEKPEGSEPPQDPNEAGSAAPSSSTAPPVSAIPSRISRSSKNAPVSPKDAKAMQKLLYSLLDVITSHRNGSVFQNPVRKSDATDYYDIIKRPMNLKMIRQRIRDGHITSIDEFERDVLLMFSNAMMYNDEDSQVYDMALEMMKESENQIAHFRTMQHDLGR